MTQAISGIIQKQCDKIENILGKIQLAYISMKKNHINLTCISFGRPLVANYRPKYIKNLMIDA